MNTIESNVKELSKEAKGRDVKQTIRDFIVKNFYVPEGVALTDETSLLDHGIVDSTGVLEVTAFLEQELGIHVDDADIVPENMDSIRSIASFVASKRSE